MGFLGLGLAAEGSTVSFTNEVHGIAWTTVEEAVPSPRRIHLLRWDPKRVELRVVVPSQGRVTVSNVVVYTKARAGVNGSYFDMETGLPTVFLKTPRKTYPGLDWDTRDGGALVWREKGNVEIRKKPAGGWSESDGEIVVAGWPLFIEGGEVSRFPDTPSYREYHPRTAVAIGPEGFWYWIVVDGRSDTARGMQVQELGEWIKKRLNASVALGLDGGGSSTLVIRDSSGARVLNKPANPGHQQRPVGNALVLFSRSERVR